MNDHALAVLALSAALMGHAHAGTCAFDQAGVAAELRRIAERNPGGQPLAGNYALEWHERDGRTVSLNYGGCEDLQAGIRVVVLAEKPQPGTDELLAAVARYWSAAQAEALRAALQSGHLTRRTEGDISILQASGTASAAFPFGFMIQFDKHSVAISWQIA